MTVKRPKPGLLTKLTTAFVIVLMSVATGFAQDKSGAAGKAALRDYQLAAGDTIHIVVFQSPDLTLDTRVSETGTITFPLAGSVSIGGLTIAAAEGKIASALESGGFVKKPQVNINLVQIIGNQVAVLGYVNRPGSYPLMTFNTRLSQILATAGGIELGQVQGSFIVILSGVREGRNFTKRIDIRSVYLDDHPEDDVVLYGGDSIFVPKSEVYYIYGQVTHPGQLPLERNMTLVEALASAGGPTPRGSERRIRVTRRGSDGTQNQVSLNLEDPVLPDDVIYVNESFF